jgi:hypothetical protein
MSQPGRDKQERQQHKDHDMAVTYTSNYAAGQTLPSFREVNLLYL